jgi:FtsZ-interacting cell division protein ZipA
MTIYNLLMIIGLVVVIGVIVKGFWSSTRVKPMEQPDNWQRHIGSD